MKLTKIQLMAAGLAALTLPAVAIEAPRGEAPPPPAPASPSGGGAGRLRAVPVIPEDEESPRPERRRERSEAAAPSAYLGVLGSHVPDVLSVHLGLKEGEGVLLRTLDPEGPASKAGLKINDIVLRVDGGPISSHEELTTRVQTKKPGDEISLDLIQEGKEVTRKVILGTRDEGVVTRAFQGGRAGPLDDVLRNLPEAQADRIRDAVERNLRNAEAAHPFRELQEDADSQIPEIDQTVREMQKRMEKMLQGAHGAAMPRQLDLRNQSESVVRLLDDQGSVELKSVDGKKSVRVLDKGGKELWSGPWDGEEDKSAAPADVRSRVENLNIDPTFKGNGFRLQLGKPLKEE